MIISYLNVYISYVKITKFSATNKFKDTSKYLNSIYNDNKLRNLKIKV